MDGDTGDELSRLTEEQQLAEARPQTLASAAPQESQTAEQLAEAMQAARVAEYREADFDHRFQMEAALRPRMKEAGDLAWAIDNRIKEFSLVQTEAEQVRLYTQEEARLTTWEIRHEAQHLKAADQAPELEAAPSQPAHDAVPANASPQQENADQQTKVDERKDDNERLQRLARQFGGQPVQREHSDTNAPAAQADASPQPQRPQGASAKEPVVKDEAANKRKADDNEQDEKRRQAHNASFQARGGSTSDDRARQQEGQRFGDDQRHSREKQVEQERHGERLERLMKQFGEQLTQRDHSNANMRGRR